MLWLTSISISVRPAIGLMLIRAASAVARSSAERKSGTAGDLYQLLCGREGWTEGTARVVSDARVRRQFGTWAVLRTSFGRRTALPALAPPHLPPRPLALEAAAAVSRAVFRAVLTASCSA